MKVLFDHNVSRQLRRSLLGHEVHTTISSNYKAASPVQEISNNFDLPEQTIRGLLTYGAKKQNQTATVRVLFDHNVPKKLRSLLPGHKVVTSRDLGWDAQE